MITETTVTDDDDEAETASRGFHLLVMSPEQFASYPLPVNGSATIGRSSKSTVPIDDPMASREHARIQVRAGADGVAFSIEDVGSANGTRVRDVPIPPGESTSIVVGEGVIVGATVMMVLQNRSRSGPRRLWLHAYFETRVEDECVRAEKAKTQFALARIRFTGPTPWTKVLPALARDVPAPHVFAAYGPKDYEILFIDLKEAEVNGLVEGIVKSACSDGAEARWGVAWYPQNGRTSDALLASANALLRVGKENPSPDGAAAPNSEAMQRVREMAGRVASSPINVLILGETGVGKDVLAQSIHRLSPRATKPFLALNCAGLSESLLESELFGHEKGAFTGATAAKAGLFESADGGTVFLDEVGDMPLTVQARLLRVIETREVRRLGSLRARPVDVRFLAATNKDLEGAVTKGEFRSDLMFRLNGISLEIPPLRNRRDEIPVLVQIFLNEGCREMGRELLSVSAEAMAYLVTYRWPGNIRELKNVIERAIVLCDQGEIVSSHLPLEKMAHVGRAPAAMPLEAPSPFAGHETLPPLNDPTKLAERQRIIDALAACASNQTRAAQLLGMPRRTFVSKLDYYHIPRPQKGAHSGDLEVE